MKTIFYKIRTDLTIYTIVFNFQIIDHNNYIFGCTFVYISGATRKKMSGEGGYIITIYTSSVIPMVLYKLLY